MINQDEIKLSICIATFNRAAFIGETLDSILAQMLPGVELIVVDGASPDNTPEVMAEYVLKNPDIRYYREKENSGVDGDYDKAVGYARGKYCWLMTDDDLLKEGSIQKVLSAIDIGKNLRDLIIVNAELRNTDLSEVLDKNRLNVNSDFEYQKNDSEVFFKNTASFLSFIGCVVINRDKWIARNRSNYYGSYFIHVGVIFQHPPLENIFIISEPLIIIRHGNSMWTPRSFEIWSFRWQQLIWSFEDFSDESKSTICHREPWRRFQTLLYARAMGAYSIVEYQKFLASRLVGKERLSAYTAARFPSSLANIIVITYFSLFQRSASLALYDLLRTRSVNFLSRTIARIFGIKA